MKQRLALAALILLAATACSDGTTGNTPVVPPGRPAPLGIIRGTVSGDSMRAVFIPYGSDGPKNSAVSPAVYGDGSTIAVTGTFVSLVDHSPTLTTRTWTFNVHMRNLLSIPIGSNYAASNPAPPDTSGVFVFFTTAPFITQSTSCSGCTIAASNWGGTTNFTNPNQAFFWYKDRPTAMQGSPGTDQTSDIPWQFTGTFNGSDSVHAFTFALEVSAAWPPPNDTLWAYSYSGKTDSLPDQFAKPRWKTPYTQINQYTTLGSETFNIGTDLVLTAATGTSSIYIARNDSLDAPSLASIFLEGKLGSAIAGVPIQAVIGIVQPGASGTQAVLGFYADHVAFVNLDPVTGLWSDVANPLSTFPVTATASHKYRIRKEGSLNLYLLCVDGSVKAFLLPGDAQASSPDFGTTTVFFGALGNATAAANLHVTTVAYTIGSDGGGC